MSSQVGAYLPSISTNLQFMLTITFVQYVYMSICCIVALIIFGRFYTLMLVGSQSGPSRLSAQLKIHLCAWTFFIIVSLLHFGSGVFMWSGEEARYYTWFVSIKSAGSWGALASAPMSSMFVTIDRIYAISFYSYGQRKRQIYVRNLSVVMIISVFVSIFSILMYRINAVTKSTRTSCVTLTCLANNNIRDLVWFKFSTGVVNLMLGTIFVCLYYRYGKHLIIRVEKRKNFLALLILINEICFNLIPTAIYILFYVNSVLYVSGQFGSIMSTAYCTDGLCTALIYYFTWYKRFIFQQRSNQVASIKINGFVSSGSTPNTKYR